MQERFALEDLLMLTDSRCVGRVRLCTDLGYKHSNQVNGVQATRYSCLRIYMYKPSGTPSFFLYITFSLAFLKSTCVTRIRRSRKANKPASVQTALMSAPDNSSCMSINNKALNAQQACKGRHSTFAYRMYKHLAHNSQCKSPWP